MGKYKTSYRVYFAWDFDREIEDLNQKSREGWQLIEGGCFHSRFELDNNVCYRYQIDFNNKVDNLERYVEMFREQGWEYINSTYNNWHYFRKKYNENLPQEEYQIYTDYDSKKEMAERWLKIAKAALAISIIGLCVSIFSNKGWDGESILMIFYWSIFTALFSVGTVNMKRMAEGKQKLSRIYSEIIRIAWMILLVLLIVNIFIV